MENEKPNEKPIGRIRIRISQDGKKYVQGQILNKDIVAWNSTKEGSDPDEYFVFPDRFWTPMEVA